MNHSMRMGMRGRNSLIASLFSIWLGAGAHTCTAQDLQLIGADTQWRYNKSGTELGTAWRNAAYDDTGSGWEGPGMILFGFETTPATYAPLTFRTPLPDPLAQFVTNFYFRTHFTMPNVPANLLALTTLLTTNYIDDGCVYYLNGVEILRYNMPTGEVNAATFALGGLVEGYSATANETIFIRTNAV